MHHSPNTYRDLPALVIEDQPLIAWEVEGLLRDMGFEKIVVACTAPAAILAYQSQPPKLIVTDLHLGYREESAFSALKQIDRQSQVAKVIVTGSDMNDDVQELLTAPNCVLVRKPFDPEDLRGAVQKVLVSMHGPN